MIGCLHGQRASGSAAAAAGSAAKAMGGKQNFTFHQHVKVEIKNGHRFTIGNLHTEHLVKIAVVKSTIITHTDK